MHIVEFQDLMRRTYLERDRKRGSDGVFRRLVEEIGEVARTLRDDDPERREHEFADAVAWLVSLANLTGVELEKAAARYQGGCPKCGQIPCDCPFP
ncbi:MAG TPA: MazG nucleotide pyrophosphohydrolase domain-containing protein [Actinomycetota bacterium]|jgi:NTP pyrophosphatase (non-canonical NTP hydrolase)|nr:MazG nucleotide pyrophosphohydrolase domain-containing protein [Actinomycetota bacterium]